MIEDDTKILKEEITELNKAKEDLDKDLDTIGNKLAWYKYRENEQEE